MNEQMKNFYDQVGLDFENFQRVTVTKGDMEKFAELIVKECAQVCNNIDAEYKGEDVLATWCANAIKKHFGVEE